MKTIVSLISLTTIFIFYCCNSKTDSHGHSHDVVSGADGNNQKTELMQITEFSEDYELFVEFSPLVINNKTVFTTHITKLKDHQPVEEGKLTISLVKDGKGIRHKVDNPVSSGIFIPALLPKETGSYRLDFEFENSEKTVLFRVKNIDVHADENSAVKSLPQGVTGNIINFKKEQAWKSDFETAVVVEQPFHTVIKTSGRIKNHPQSEISLTTQSNGTINVTAILGESVQKGTTLAYLSGAGIENDFTIKLNSYRIAFEKSKADYNRTRKLVNSQIISKKDFLDIHSKYLQDSIHYHQWANNVSGKVMKIRAPFDGYVSEIFVSNGEYIETGTEVITMSNEKELLIETYVNQSDFSKVNTIFDAHFKLPSGDSILTLEALNGKLRSANAFVPSTLTRIPVTFVVSENSNLMPGMFLEAYLMAGKKEIALVIPISAITEEQGQYYVYIQTGGETYVKKEIFIANIDGIRAEIISGLKPGDRIVSKGAYQIRLASLAGDLPIHGHTH